MNNQLFSNIKDELILVLDKRKKMLRMMQNNYRKRQTNLLTRMEMCNCNFSSVSRRE